MKTASIFVVLCLMSLNALCQSKIDTLLQKKIIFMFRKDQKWRIESEKLINGKKSAYNEAAINRNMAKTDSLNMGEAKSIIAKYGFPGYDLVGEGYSNDFWAIVQHCDDDVKFQQYVLVLLSEQVNSHNASAENFALLQDRVLIGTGKKQLFGTQVRYNPKTKTAKPLPTQDSANVDKRRKSVGLSPLNEYLKLFDRN
ncbi:MAG: hypothetical protein JWP78_140 [Mucilaginibacter sp.]|nr:hypothetical protein [Mucilaginibacter sp.]